MSDFCRYFDHAILKSNATEAQVISACEETLAWGFFGLAVNPVWNALVAQRFKDKPAALVAVCGFPLGATNTAQKIIEAVTGVEDGAHEIDMVANIGRIVAGDFIWVEREIRAIRDTIPQRVGLKVIIEAPLLTENQQRDSARAVVNAGAQFVKSATGFFGSSTPQICRTLVDSACGEAAVKISGGVRTLAQAEEYIHLGATRLGSSASVAIMRELGARESALIPA